MAAGKTDTGAATSIEDEWDSTASDEWDRADSGYGEAIDFTVTKRFQGTFTGFGEIEDVERADGTRGPVKVYTFTDRAGNACFAWYTYELDQALTEENVGREVRIEKGAKKDIGGGRTLNQFFVAFRRVS